MSAGPAANAPGSAGPSPLVMPSSLRRLVLQVEQLTTASSASACSSKDQRPAAASPSSTPLRPEGAGVPTADLLQMVRDIQQHYTKLLELSEVAYRPRKEQHPQRVPGADASVSETAVQEAERCMTDLEKTVATLQSGIRSKLAQSSRLVVLNALRREVAERRQRVATMEGVLSVAHQHVRL